ncbi:MAG: XRE family transcriptional regulator [Terriglobia bacterium]
MEHRKFSELTKNWTPERRARVQAEAPKLIDEMPLHELRQARNLTQAQLAQSLHLDQPSVSKIERRTDMYISTLANFVEAMGGQLEIKAVFPDGEVRITHFGNLPDTVRTR